jgi:GAF domain-containing protein
MRRGAKPAKAKVEVKQALTRKSLKSNASRVRDLERRLAESLEREKATGGLLQTRNRELAEAQEARNRELTESLEQQTATGEILRVISTSPTDVQPVFDTIVRSATLLCGGMYGSATRFDGELLHLAAGYNYTPEVDRALREAFPMRPSPRSMSGRAILARDVVQVEDALEDADYMQDVARAGGFRSMLAAPMLHDGRPIGTIVVNRGQPGSFSRTQVELLKTFASQAVIAIENVRLFTELQERTRELARSVEELKALGEVGQAVSSTLDLETVLSTIAARADQLSGTDGAAIYEFDEATESFHLRVALKLEEELRSVRPAHTLGRRRGRTGGPGPGAGSDP